MPRVPSPARAIRLATGLSVTAAIVIGYLAATQTPAKAAHPAKATHPAPLSFLVKQQSAATQGPSFPRAGDTIVVMQQNVLNGRVIGHDGTACIVTNSTQLLQCATTVTLPGGFFEVAFPEVLGAKNITAPISSATGRYAGITGYFVLHQLNDTEYRATLHTP
jgi:hypothetical protein